MNVEARIDDPISADTDSYQAYLEVRTSLFHFGKFPSQLEEQEEQQKLANEVAKQQAINLSVQTSPEYSQMVVPEQELDMAIQEIYEQIPEEVELDSLLFKNGLTHATLRESIETDLRVAAVLNYIAEQQPEITDLDAELFYQLHSDRFIIPEQRTVRHILVTINEDFAENKRDVALGRIKKARKELLKKPFKFAKFSKSTSECPTALEGGLLGTVTAGQLYPELDKVLFAMNEGEISEVVESELGFHILLCEAITPELYPPFDEVKDKIRSSLRKRNQRGAQRQWLQQRMQATGSSN